MNTKENKYETVRDEIINDIQNGIYPVGALLPSVREITIIWNVSTSTGRKVLSELVRSGYARSKGTRGHIVASSKRIVYAVLERVAEGDIIVEVCDECGSLIVDMKLHESWHKYNNRLE